MKKDFKAIYRKIRENELLLCSEYAEHTIVVPWAQRWKYAIPENYTNYQDGFIAENEKPYRGMPLLDHNGKILYLRWIVPIPHIKEGYCEQYLLFDRFGKKYTFLVEEATQEESESKIGNPSYFEFLPRVKKYKPRRPHA